MPPKKESQNIQVSVRCRPLNSQERTKGSLTAAECFLDRVTVRERNAPSAASKTFTFDKVFGPLSKQTEVYRTIVRPIVEEVLEGYNCTVFAYGQTGTGKTFTMVGERSDELKYSWEDDPLSGIIPRSLSHLFDRLESNGGEFSVRVSFMELYNEELFDLLSTSDDAQRLRLFDDANRKGSVMVQGLEEVVVTNKDAVYAIIERGMQKRATASTLLNAQSSRSHSVFTVTAHMRENSVDGEEMVKIGKLNLVDLAGSENIGRSGAIDKRAREAGNINQSLLTLGRVITALVERTPHVPYRESKLTRILQDSLGGRTKTSIIATISPSSLNLEETLSTLDYAHRAKNIQNKPEVNQKLSKKALLREYSDEVERLRRDLQAARDKNGFYMDVGNYTQLQTTLQQQRERIKEQEDLVILLRGDLEKMTDVLNLTQEELDAIRQSKELLEVDLEATRVQAARIRQRLIATEVMRREERFVKEAHQSTEDKLAAEAASLMESADASVDDVAALHEKVDRMRTTEADNRSRVEVFSEEMEGRAKEISAHILSHSAEAASSLNAVQTKLNVHSNGLTEWCSSAREHVAQLVSDWQTEASEFNDLCDQQSTQNHDSLVALGLQIAELLDKKRQRMTNVKASVQSAIGDDLSVSIRGLCKQLSEAESQNQVDAKEAQFALSQLEDRQRRQESVFCDDVVSLLTAQKTKFCDLRQKIEADFAKEEQFLRDYQRQRETTKQLMLIEVDAACEAACTQLQEVVDRVKDGMSSTTATLGAVRGQTDMDAVKRTEQLVQIQKTCGSLLEEELLSAEAKILHQMTEMDEALENNASALAAAVDSEKEASASRSDALVTALQQRLEPPVKTATLTLDESATSFEERTGTELRAVDKAVVDFRSTSERELLALETKLKKLRVAVSSFLQEDIRPTLATGQTPARRIFDYPRQLSRTSPQARLRDRFRAQIDRMEVEAMCDLSGIVEDDIDIDSDALRPRRPSSGIGSTYTQSSSRPNSPAENVDPQVAPEVGKMAKSTTTVGPRKKPLKTKN